MTVTNGPTESSRHSLAKRPVLVTGADGFIGSHLVQSLLASGARVRALAMYNSFNHWGWLEALPDPSQVEVVTGDIRDPDFCLDLCRDMEVIFHLAALIAIPYSYVAPASYVETNVLGTLHVCQGARRHGCRRLIHMSTSEVYGTARYVPIDEKHPLQPQSPYSASKVGADAVAWSFHDSFGLPLTVARPFNTYGPRQSSRAVIPTIITQIAAGATRINLGDLTPTRDFIYVADTVQALVALAESPDALGQVINIGTNKEWSIRHIVERIQDLMGVQVEIKSEEPRYRPAGSEVFRLLCDNARLRDLVGFVPKVDLDDGLKKTIAWFTDPTNLSRYKPNLYNK